MSFSGQGRLRAEQEELGRLQRENTRLQQENAFLKRVAAYFARELCKYTKYPAAREQPNSRTRCSAFLWMWGTSRVRPWGQGRLGPRPEERPELTKPIAPSIDMQHLDVMKEPVQDRGRQNLIIGKDRWPVTHMLVRREHDAAALVAGGDQSKEQVRLTPIERPKADLVDDQESRVEVPLGAESGGRHRGIGASHVHQIIKHEVRDGGAVLDRLHPKRCREMTLPHTRWPEKEHVGLFADEAAGRERLDLPPVHTRLEAPVEVFEHLSRR